MAGMVLEGNSYVLARMDGVLIDGRPEGLSAQLFDAAIARERAAAAANGPSAAVRHAIVPMIYHVRDNWKDHETRRAAKPASCTRCGPIHSLAGWLAGWLPDGLPD